jgi:hypothetical protein
MSEPENFVARWSRLKRQSEGKGAVGADAGPEAPARPPEPQARGGNDKQGGPAAQPPPPAFDPASLPSIESITADTDIRAFLQSGVPAELTKAALRRVWTSDPAIRDFIGLAENQWDFTDPAAMSGFGPLEATDDVGKLVAQAMGKLGDPAGQLAEPSDPEGERPAPGVQCSTEAAAPDAPATGIQASGMPAGNPVDPGIGVTKAEQDQVSGAAQHAMAPAERGPAPNRRPRGRALPK